MMSDIVSRCLTPPGCLLFLLLGAYLVRPTRPTLAKRLFWLFGLLLYSCSTPLCATGAVSLTQRVAPLQETDLEGFRPQAVVVLGGGAQTAPPEYPVPAAPSASTLQRLLYAQYLHQRTQLPLMVTGGLGEKTGESEGEAMQFALGLVGIEPNWVETESRNTRQNALHCHRLLETEKITRILLVTHASHMVRARRSFQEVGFQVLPAPTGFVHLRDFGPVPLCWVPSAAALQASAGATRSLIAELAYRLL